jgi:ketosteroid isomerase-like protein
MTDSEQRIAQVAEGWRAFEEGGAEAVLPYLDPEIEVHASADVGNPGTFHGRDEWRNWVGHWFDAWDQFDQEVVGVEAVGERSVIADVVQRARGRSTGVELERTVSYVYELRDGKVVYLGLFADTETARAAAGERESG